MVHTEFHLEPTAVDIREISEALNGDETFLRFTEDEKTALFVRVLNIKRIMELHDDVAELNETTKRANFARKVQTRFEGALEIVKENKKNAHWLQTLADIRKLHGLTFPGIIEWEADLEERLGAVLRSSKRTWPRKKYLPPPTRPPKALAEVGMMVAVLEGLGVYIGVTGGEQGGPATRLMIRIHAYVSGGKVIRPYAIKDRLNRLREWNASHPEWMTRVRHDLTRD